MTKVDHHQPEYQYWKTLPTLSVGEIACLMKGVDPRVASDVVNHEGDGLDMSSELRKLFSAIQIGELAVVLPLKLPTVRPTSVSPNFESVIARTKLTRWLRLVGHGELADELGSEDKAEGRLIWTDEFKEEVRKFRAEHGTKAAAIKFGISSARIRKKLPGNSVGPRGYNVFNQKSR